MSETDVNFYINLRINWRADEKDNEEDQDPPAEEPLDDFATPTNTENTYEAPQAENNETLLSRITQALGLRPITVHAAQTIQDNPTEFVLYWYKNNNRREDMGSINISQQGHAAA